jgi:error-prone DNA polymerase
LAEFRPTLLRQGYWAAVQVAGTEGPRTVRYAGLVICRQRPGTAKGVLFLTLEDETGTVNVVVWKNVWERYRKVILTSSFLGVSGKLQNEDGVVHLIADRFWVPEAENTPSVRVSSRDFQ